MVNLKHNKLIWTTLFIAVFVGVGFTLCMKWLTPLMKSGYRRVVSYIWWTYSTVFYDCVIWELACLWSLPPPFTNMLLQSEHLQ